MVIASTHGGVTTDLDTTVTTYWDGVPAFDGLPAYCIETQHFQLDAIQKTGSATASPTPAEMLSLEDSYINKNSEFQEIANHPLSPYSFTATKVGSSFETQETYDGSCLLTNAEYSNVHVTDKDGRRLAGAARVFFSYVVSAAAVVIIAAILIAVGNYFGVPAFAATNPKIGAAYAAFSGCILGIVGTYTQNWVIGTDLSEHNLARSFGTCVSGAVAALIGYYHLNGNFIQSTWFNGASRNAAAEVQAAASEAVTEATASDHMSVISSALGSTIANP